MNIPDTRLILAGLTAAAMLLVVAKKQEVEDVFVPPSQRASLLLQTVLSHAPQAEALYKAILNKDATVAPYPISGIHVVTTFDPEGHIHVVGRLERRADGNYYLTAGGESMYLPNPLAEEIIKKSK